MHGMQESGERNSAGRMFGPLMLLAILMAKHPQGHRVLVPKMSTAVKVWLIVGFLMLLTVLTGSNH